jgi:hypothetical protein
MGQMRHIARIGEIRNGLIGLILDGESERKNPGGKFRCMSEDKVNMNLKEIGSGGRILMARGRIQQYSLANTY